MAMIEKAQMQARMEEIDRENLQLRAENQRLRAEI
jgi:hypothetical protein